MMKYILIFLIFPIVLNDTSYSSSQNKEVDWESVCLSSKEKDLIDLINAYRKQKKLAPVKISKSMTYVAQLHVREMQDKFKDITHSWVGCKYRDNNPKTYHCMWDKPKELTGYPSDGYECAFAQWGAPFSAKDILDGWKSSRGHNQIIINKNGWDELEWNAIGVGIYGNYAALWLGTDEDPNGTVVICD